MGYGIMPYRVKLSKVERCIGMQDESMKQYILEGCEDRLARLDQSFDFDEGPIFPRLMKGMLDGKIEYPAIGFAYWYCIELLVQGFGEMLPNGSWYPAGAEAFWDCSAASLYAISTTPSIPSPDDFPTVFVLKNEKLNDEMLAEVKDKMDEEQFVEFKGWVDSALQHGQDLVLYYY